MSKDKQEVHKHYHYSVIPNNSDCFLFGCCSIVAICIAAVYIIDIIWKGQ